MSINYYAVNHAAAEDIYIGEADISIENTWSVAFTTEANRGHFIANSIIYMITKNNTPINAAPILAMSWGTDPSTGTPEYDTTKVVHKIFTTDFSGTTSGNNIGYTCALNSYDLQAVYDTVPVPASTIVRLRNSYSSGNPSPSGLFVKYIVKGFYIYG